MEMIPVASRNVEAVGYDSSNRWLDIRFKSGGLYRYFEVPSYEHQQLMAAASKGSYHARNIKERYEYVRL